MPVAHPHVGHSDRPPHRPSEKNSNPADPPLTSTAAAASPLPPPSATSPPSSSQHRKPPTLPNEPIILPSDDPSALPALQHRRRTDTSGLESALPHLSLELESLQARRLRLRDSFAITAPSNPLTPGQNNAPTASIAIPQRKASSDQLTTPLSGRPPAISSFDITAVHLLSTDHLSSSPGSQNSSDMSTSPTKSARPLPLPPQSAPARPYHLPPPASSYRMSSPLSPTRPVPVPVGREQRSRKPRQGLNLSGLPKFHPANFPQTDSTSLSPHSARQAPSATRGGRYASDAQTRLQQYQRDVISSFAKTTGSPQVPKLEPQGSPGGPITPLALEAESDYLSAKSRHSPSGTVSARDWVDQLIQRENERRSHPDARSGSLSPGMSPNISPAVSPAGGG